MTKLDNSNGLKSNLKHTQKNLDFFKSEHIFYMALCYETLRETLCIE